MQDPMERAAMPFEDVSERRFPARSALIAAASDERSSGRLTLVGETANDVAKHAAGAGIREDRCTAHALRHMFCTMRAERGIALGVSASLPGHVDVRTTQIYRDPVGSHSTSAEDSAVDFGVAPYPDGSISSPQR